MRISQECDYAFRIVLYFASREPKHKADAKTVVEVQRIPLRFALKIFRKLCGVGVLQSFRGVNGGYSMLLSPEEVTFKQIIECIDGPIYLNKCLRPDGECSRSASGDCPVQKTLEDTQNSLADILDGIRFSDVVCA